MNKKAMIGGSLITVAFIMFMSGLGDQLEHLQNFDGLTLVQAAGALLKQVSAIALAAVGGTLIPTPAPKWDGLKERRKNR